MNQQQINKLPYRQGVQIYILNDDKKLLIMHDPGHWKIPAGDMDEGETPEQTAHREIKEEFDIPVEIIGKSQYKNEFLWPEYHLKKYDYKYKGQRQHIFIAKLKPNQKFNVQKDEVIDYKWIPKEDIGQYFNMQSQITMANKIFNEFKELF